MRTVPTAALLLMLACSGATSQEIPAYDSGAHCQRLSRDPSDNTATGRCLWVEDYARDELETFWPRTSATMRRTCIEAAEEESYAALATCILGRLRDAGRER